MSYLYQGQEKKSLSLHHIPVFLPSLGCVFICFLLTDLYIYIFLPYWNDETVTSGDQFCVFSFWYFTIKHFPQILVITVEKILLINRSIILKKKKTPSGPMKRI